MKETKKAAMENQDSRAFRTDHLIILQNKSSYTYDIFVIPEEYRSLTNKELTGDPAKVKKIKENKNGEANIHSESDRNYLTLHEVSEYQAEVVHCFTKRAKELEVHLFLELF